MANTFAGALQTYLTDKGFNLPVSQDISDGSEIPYITVMENVVSVPYLDGDNRLNKVAETMQINLWQEWRDSSGAVIENRFLADTLLNLLHCARIETDVKKIFAIIVESQLRVIEEENNLIQNVFTIVVKRKGL